MSTCLHPADPVQHVIQDLQQIEAIGDLAAATRVGEILLRTVYQGDMARSARRGPKRLSVDTVAGRADCPFSATTLRRCLRVLRVMLLEPDLAGAPGLTLRHVHLVLGRPIAEQRALLLSAAAGRWSTRRLALYAVRRARRPSDSATKFERRIPA